jgi:hypothetical protein
LIFYPSWLPDPGVKRHRIPDTEHCFTGCSVVAYPDPKKDEPTSRFRKLNVISGLGMGPEGFSVGYLGKSFTEIDKVTNCNFKIDEKFQL